MSRLTPILFPLLLAISAALPVQAADKAVQKYLHVLAAKVKATGSDAFDFDITISSPHDTPRRYANAFRVTHPDGTLHGERVRWHDHASEQPFTRDLYNVKVPHQVRTVIIQARDRTHAYGG